MGPTRPGAPRGEDLARRRRSASTTVGRNESARSASGRPVQARRSSPAPSDEAGLSERLAPTAQHQDGDQEHDRHGRDDGQGDLRVLGQRRGADEGDSLTTFPSQGHGSATLRARSTIQRSGRSPAGFRPRSTWPGGWWQTMASVVCSGVELEALASRRRRSRSAPSSSATLALSVRSGQAGYPPAVPAAPVLLAEEAGQAWARPFSGEAELLADAMVPVLGQSLGHLHPEAVEEQVPRGILVGVETGRCLPPRTPGSPW